jgi:hypothetical protein
MSNQMSRQTIPDGLLGEPEPQITEPTHRMTNGEIEENIYCAEFMAINSLDGTEGDEADLEDTAAIWASDGVLSKKTATKYNGQMNRCEKATGWKRDAISPVNRPHKKICAFIYDECINKNKGINL